eukprot:c2503_g1_i1 orf=23-1045(+)
MWAGSTSSSSPLLMATASSTSFQHWLRASKQLSARPHSSFPSISRGISFSLRPPTYYTLHSSFLPHRNLLICRSTSTTEPPQEKEAGSSPSGGQLPPGDGADEADGGGGGAMGRVSSVFIFAFWAAFIAYCAFLSPNQTPVTDQYFLEKLLNLKVDDGFQMNQVLTCLWYIMGLWPVIYCMLLIPSGRSSRNRIPVWPFTTLSCFAGAFALLPYFGLWQPPPPKVSKEEIERWPLKILDSKILSIVVAVAGACLLGVAATAGSESWAEFMKYFNSSRFLHIMSLDFLALSSLAPFWVFNDMEVRKGSSIGSWAPALAFIPFVGPALYLILRPSLRPDDTN